MDFVSFNFKYLVSSFKTSKKIVIIDFIYLVELNKDTIVDLPKPE